MHCFDRHFSDNFNGHLFNHLHRDFNDCLIYDLDRHLYYDFFYNLYFFDDLYFLNDLDWHILDYLCGNLKYEFLNDWFLYDNFFDDLDGDLDDDFFDDLDRNLK